MRDRRIDFARGTAVMMMILQHVCIFLHSDEPNVTLWSAILVEVILMITKSAVPLFLIVTGSVLLDDKKDIPIK